MHAEPDESPPWKEELDAVIAARHGGALAVTLPRLEQLAERYPNIPEIHYQIAWTCDTDGQPAGAIPHYEKAIAQGMSPIELSGAMLGLGSSLRLTGAFDRSEKVLRDGKARFPDHHEFDVFLAMTLHNLGRHAEAMELLLTTLVDTAEDPGITAQGRTIRFLASQLDRRWD